MERMGKIFKHGLFALLVGCSINYVGRGEIIFRSVGVLAIAAWLIFESWVWILRSIRSLYKWAVGAATTDLILIISLGIMYWFLSGKLLEDRVNSWNKLDSTVFLPPSQDALDSIFTITNYGEMVIGKHQISCIPNRIVTDRFLSVEGEFGHLQHIWPDIPIKRSGDSQSDNCLSGMFNNFGSVVCADVTLDITYELLDQPNATQFKRWRFVTSKGEGSWHRQALDYPGSYCKQN